ncbi:hypothetical protein JGH11_01970 [Dysgonomonas sp. Marseille-P4677]|uniref:hypothetical protein n=1 Tax=Dysgonomonas sp. Marseille-P4677 TaxID=2364790 RepID=UPI0019140A52|nr:hypothetical protein [Dysgonomonas sp. Marseille-P4677]MBK5719631.1 hypothetical protein [Dysgonomonas sp. Marseille-P4677]
MRKIFLLATLCVCLGSQAQNKRVWLDAEVEQNFRLNNWFDNTEINKGMGYASSTDLKARFSWRCYQNIGIYSDLSIAAYHGENRYNPTDILNEFELSNYYIRDVYSWGGEDVCTKMSFGLFYKFQLKKIDLIPRLGIGFESLITTSASNILKKKGSNDMYTISYDWDIKDTPLQFASLELSSSYRISRITSLIFGLSYRYRFSKPEFKSMAYDYYDRSLINDIHIKGNNTSTIGVSLGVSFGWGR